MPTTPTSVFDLIYPIITSEKFIAGSLGLIGGVIATFIAPWTKWHFKEKELKRESRIEKIEKWEQEISENRNDYEAFKKTITFTQLKDKISKEELASFEPIPAKYGDRGQQIIDTPIQRIHVKEKDKVGRFQELISKIEKEWNLI